MEKNYTTALFDVDGTIVTLSGVIKALQEALTQFDLEAMSSKDIIHHFVGKLVSVEFPKLYPHMANEVDAFIDLYTNIFVKKHKHLGKLQPYVKETFKVLRDNHIKIGIVTTKGRKEALAVMEDYNLPYDVLVSHNEVSAIKPSPEPIKLALDKLKEVPGKAVMTGDHVFDVISAHEAGCTGVGVLTGASTKEEFRKIRTEYIIKNLSELPRVMGL